MTIATAVLLLAGATALAYNQKWWPFTSPENYIIDGINYGPPTEEEIENSQNAKKDIIEEDENNDSSENTSNNGGDFDLRKVNVGISHSEVFNGNVEIRAFVSGVVEGTGTCTATLTQSGAQTVTESKKAFIDSTTSQCEPILIPVSEFNVSGDWTLIVNYKSPTSYGESEKIIVNI